MDPLDLMQEFVERCERSVAESELRKAFQNALEQMGFRYFACCSHVNPEDPPQRAVILHNYPDQWVCSYAGRNLHEFDPVFLRAEQTILPFSWDAPEFRASLTPPQKQLMREAMSFGIAHGYTVPIHLPWVAGLHHASCSVVPDSQLIDARAYYSVQLMSIYLYDSVRRQAELRAGPSSSVQLDGVLSSRERQCLELAAQGKSDWDISRLLCISQHTVHKHIETAKRKLAVTTRVQAVVRAVQRGEISLGDVVKADPLTKDATVKRVRIARAGKQHGTPRGDQVPSEERARSPHTSIVFRSNDDLDGL